MHEVLLHSRILQMFLDKPGMVSFRYQNQRVLCRKIGKHFVDTRNVGYAPTPFFQIRISEEWSQGVTYIAGVNEMLADLASKYTLVLVTNTHHAGLVRKHLQDSGMEQYFMHVITSVEHGRRKPDRSIFEHALQVSNCKKETALFVGDSYFIDYEGARVAGLPCLLIDPNQRHSIPNPHRLNGILNLPSAISRANHSFQRPCKAAR